VKKDFDTYDKINYLSKLLLQKFKANIIICIIDHEGSLINKNNSNNIKIFNSFNSLLIYIKTVF